jgi:uncharacterized membrane protein required for colicin V production
MLSKKSAILFMLIVFFMITGFMFWQTGLLLGILTTVSFIFAVVFAWSVAKVVSPYKKEVNDILRHMEGGARLI